MNKPVTFAFLLNAVFLFYSIPSIAQDAYIPPDLEPWREWVLYDKEHLECPFFNASQYGNKTNHRCAWPGALELSLAQKGGTFTQVWRVYQDGWILLPGNNEHWPLDVKVNGNAIDVANRNNTPAIFLGPGTHRISGRFEWVTRPGLFPVPAMTALLNLTLDGNEISVPDWRGAGIWLGDRDRVVEEQERVDVVVYRAISDGVPITVDTRIEIDVSGPSREEVLGVALLDDFVPMAIQSALPARLESDGRLRVQVRPGSWVILVTARASEPGDTITMQTASAPWPDEEIWSYKADSRLRVTAPDALSPVDPDQVGVPSGWYQLPAFRMKPGEALTIIERQRGLTDQDANRLNLNRLLWMDFEGSGLTAVDVLTGSMRRDWRLDMHLPFVLNNATDKTQSESYLVTGGDEEGSTGIEIRTPNVNLVTQSRIEHGGRIPVTGWNADFESVGATLLTPPGVRLLAAPGSDRAIGAWASRWRLLDFFLVLIIAVAAGRLVNPVFGVITLVMLVFTYHEPYAPAWSWLNLLIAIALASVAPEGRLRKFTRRYLVASIAIMVIIAVPFVANQARLAMFPQLENVNLTATRYATPFDHNFLEDGYSNYRAGATYGQAMRARQAQFARVDRLVDSSVVDQRAVVEDVAEQGLITVTGSRIQRVDAEGPSPVSVIDRDEVEAMGDTSVDSVLAGRIQGAAGSDSRERRLPMVPAVETDAAQKAKQIDFLSRYGPNTRLQTGPGYPQWRWSTYTLQWSGPVDPAQSMRLIVSPAWLTAIWRVLGALLLIWVLVQLVRSHISWPKMSTTTGNVAAAILLVLCFGPLGVVDARAEVPDANMLAELQKRLTKGPECLQFCSEIVEASVRVSPDSVTIAMEMHANTDIAAALPGRKGRWMPTRIFVDGRQIRNLYNANGVSWVVLSKGVHQVRVEGPLASTEKHEIHFTGSIRYVRVDADGWDVSGIVDNRLLEDSLVLSRVKSEDGSRRQTLASDQFPNFALVTRKFVFDLDWTVITTVYRRAPANGTMTLAIPLLDGESVTSSDMEVRDNNVIASFSADQRRVSWRTTIPRSDALRLEAPLEKPWTEIWWLSVGQSWNIEYSGVPEIRARVTDRSAWVAEFDPLPGETLDIAVNRPTGVPGETLAIDRVVLTDKIGKRSTDSELSFYYRSTLGGQQDIRLPADADVTRVSAKGTALPLRPRDGVLPVPIEPGHGVVKVNWRTANGAAMVNRSSLINLGIDSTNLELRMSTPRDRWLLLTSGPRVGPAILYWPELVVLIAFAFVLGRFGKTPLRTVDWVLLGLGLSTFSWGMLLMFAVWVFVMDWRGRAAHLSAAPKFNLTQTFIGLLSVVVLLGLLITVPDGLLGSPNMQVVNAGRSAGLYWFQDMSSSVLPTASVISAPLWMYKVAILLWALWLSFSLIKWLPWAWRCFSYNGLWKGKVATDG